MISGNRREPVFVDSSRVASAAPDGHQLLGDICISNYMPLWLFITMVVLTLTLSVLPSTTVYAQQSAADKPSSQKSQTLRKRKAHRAKAKARKEARRNARNSQETKSQENQKNGRNRTSAAQGEVEGSDSADSASKQGSIEGDTAEQGVKTIDSALKSGATQRSNRMEFDARLVYGETAGSGAVILFERGQRHLPPLTKQRTRFLTATTEPVLGKKDKSHYRVRNDSKEDKSDKTDNESAGDGLRN